ncbi:MAG: glucose-inhibited division protein [Paenibacillaceae bacterium]|jgi:hypothetical protein|nr:glucose-inhibited division protein [Paenibacillaceae bacterium]
MQTNQPAVYDVVVVGGGISGTVGAIAAARNGSKVLVVEQYGFLGGNLTACGVGPMMTFHVEDKQVVKGITGELIDRMVANGKSPGHVFDTTGTTYTVTPFDAEGMKHELEMMLLESGGEVLYHTMLAGVSVQDGRITGIQVCNKAGLGTIAGKVYIDATGDADLSAWSGVECTMGRPQDGACQPMTMKMKMCNVDIERLKQFIRENPEEFPRYGDDPAMIDNAPKLSTGGFVKTLKEAQQRGEVTFNREEVLIFETNNPGEVIINTTRVQGHSSTDPWSLSLAEIEGRKQTRQIEKLLKGKAPGFEASFVEYTGPSIGVRSSRQIKGTYTVTLDDLMSCRKFDDVIAHGGYPIDIHPPAGEDKEGEEDERRHRHLPWGSMYSIPYSSLVNPVIHNLITVGRSISATFEAQGALRLTPIAGAIGQAGGAAASIAARNGIPAKDVQPGQLHPVLLEQGAYLDI